MQALNNIYVARNGGAGLALGSQVATDPSPCKSYIGYSQLAGVFPRRQVCMYSVLRMMQLNHSLKLYSPGARTQLSFCQVCTTSLV